jgi:hypothetical protein
MPPVTVSANANTTGLLAGNASNTAWPFTFPVQSASQLQVVHVSSAGVETVIDSDDYSVSLTDSGRSGGSVTYPSSGSPVASGAFIVVRRSMPFTQLTNLRNQGTLAPETVEAIADRVTYALQQLKEEGARAVRQPLGDADALDELPPAATRASKYLAFDSDGQLAVSATVDGAVTASAYALTLLDDANAATARATLGIPGITADATTGAASLPSGTTGQRPSPTAGMLRYNSTLAMSETYQNSTWSMVGTGMVLLGDTTITSSTATVDFTGAWWDRFRALMLVVTRAMPVTSTANLLCRLSINAGSAWISTGYKSGNHWGVVEGTDVGTTGAGYGGTTNALLLAESLHTDTAGPNDGTFWISSNTANAQKNFWGTGIAYQASGETVLSTWGGYCASGSANAATGVRLLMSSGNIAVGRFQLYGLG